MSEARKIADSRLAKGEITADEHTKITAALHAETLSGSRDRLEDHPKNRWWTTSSLGWFCEAFIAFAIAYFFRSGTIHVICILAGLASILMGILTLILPRGK